MSQEEPHVLLEFDDNCAWLTLNRPTSRNCVTGQMIEELFEHLSEINDRDDVDVVALTGRGETFCPGADLSAAASSPSALPPLEHYQLATLLVEMPQVTVAVINGACAGPGLAWASACDLRVASTNARFSTAFVHVGLVGEFGLIWTLERNLGAARAKELMLLGDKFDAERALAIGLTCRVFDAEQFHTQSRAFVSELASRSASSLRAMKADFGSIGSMMLADYITVESVRHQSSFLGSDSQATREALAQRARGLQ